MNKKIDKERFRDWFVDYFKARAFGGASTYMRDKDFVYRQSDLYYDTIGGRIKPDDYKDFFTFLRTTESGFCDDYKFAQKCIEYCDKKQSGSTTPGFLRINDDDFLRDIEDYAVIATSFASKTTSQTEKDSYRNVGAIVAGITSHGATINYYNSLNKELKYSAFYKRLKQNDKYAKGLTQEQIELIEEGILKMKDMAREKTAVRTAQKAVKTFVNGFTKEDK